MKKRSQVKRGRAKNKSREDEKREHETGPESREEETDNDKENFPPKELERKPKKAQEQERNSEPRLQVAKGPKSRQRHLEKAANLPIFIWRRKTSDLGSYLSPMLSGARLPSSLAWRCQALGRGAVHDGLGCVLEFWVVGMTFPELCMTFGPYG